MVQKPTEIPAVTRHQCAANFQRSSVLFSRSMAKAIFFLEDNLDVYISLLLFFTSICNVELQRDYFIGRKGSLKLCAGLHFILLGFLAKQESISSADLWGRFCFSAIHALLNILQSRHKNNAKSHSIYIPCVQTMGQILPQDLKQSFRCRKKHSFFYHSAEFNWSHKDTFCWATFSW